MTGWLVGLVVFQVGDSLVVGLTTVVETENEQSKAFLSNPKQILDENQLTSVGLTISRTKLIMIQINRPHEIGRLTEAHSVMDFASRMSLALYISSHCRLNVCLQSD